MKVKPFAIIGALLLALAVQAGSVVDTDGDQVPDAFGNCPNTANGLGDRSKQYDGDGFILGDDILYCFSQFNRPVGG